MDPHGGNTRRGWIGVVLIAVLVGAATGLGVGAGVAATIRAHNTTAIKFSPNTSVFRRMNDVQCCPRARPAFGGRDPGVRTRLRVGTSRAGGHSSTRAAE